MTYLTDLSFGPDTRIVLVGTTEYPKDKELLPSIPHAKNNIDQLFKLFTDPGICGLDEGCIFQLVDCKHANEISDEIARAAQEATDTLLVYYVGHGLYGDEHAPLYLAAQETTDARKAFNGVPVTLVQRAICTSPAPKRILILDCCYSGRAFDKALAPRSTEEAAIRSIDIAGTYGIAAVPGNAKALAPENEKFTRFTGALLEVLEHGLATHDRVLTLKDVFTEVQHRVARGGAPLPQRTNWGEGERFRIALNRSALHRREESKKDWRLRVWEALLVRIMHPTVSAFARVGMMPKFSALVWAVLLLVVISGGLYALSEGMIWPAPKLDYCGLEVQDKNASPGDHKYLNFFTGSRSQYYYLFGEQLKEAHDKGGSDNENNYALNNRETAGSEQNLRELVNDCHSIALVQDDVLKSTRWPFKGILHLPYREEVYIATAKDSGIKNIENLQNKPVAIGVVNSGTNFTATNIFYRSKVHIIRKEIPVTIRSGDINTTQNELSNLLDKNNPNRVEAAVFVLKKNDQGEALTNYFDFVSIPLKPLDDGIYKGVSIGHPAHVSSISVGTTLVSNINMSWKDIENICKLINDNSKKIFKIQDDYRSETCGRYQ